MEEKEEQKEKVNISNDIIKDEIEIEDIDKEADVENNNEEYQILNIKNKKILNKIIIFTVLTLAVIITSIIAGICVSKSAKKEEKEEAQAQVDAMPDVTEEKEEENTKIPIHSEGAKQRMSTIYDSNNGEKIAYLTFDDGPSATVTPQILDILKTQDVKATFFVLGSRVELYPEIIKREYEEGHYIANHGYSHVYASIYSSPNAVLDEYNVTEARIKDALGLPEYSSHLFRFPGGSEGGKFAKIKNEAKSILDVNGASYINWNCLTSDAVGTPTHESIIEGLKNTSARKR